MQSYFTGSLLSPAAVMVLVLEWCVGRGVRGLVGTSLTPPVASALECDNEPLLFLPKQKKRAGGGAGRSLNPLESSAP